MNYGLYLYFLDFLIFDYVFKDDGEYRFLNFVFGVVSKLWVIKYVLFFELIYLKNLNVERLVKVL